MGPGGQQLAGLGKRRGVAAAGHYLLEAPLGPSAGHGVEGGFEVVGECEKDRLDRQVRRGDGGFVHVWKDARPAPEVQSDQTLTGDRAPMNGGKPA